MATQISTLGEFGLIKHLTKDFHAQQTSTQKAIGDDAAVLNFGNKRTLVTTDLLLEGIHFNLEYVPLKHLGYKAAVVNFSDIYAMNGKPTQITVSLGISQRFSVEDLEQLYEGIKLACERYGVDLVGGDTCASMTGLTISITCLGEAYDSDIVYRNGAQVNDLICVTGNLGTAYMGLQLLERERIVMNTDENATPAFEGREYLLERQLKPEARYASQLNMYLNYYRHEVMQADDNPPIGLLLCTDYGKTSVQYATEGLSDNLFVSKYRLQLPSEDEIRKYLEENV